MEKKLYNEPSVQMIGLSLADVITVSAVETTADFDTGFAASFGDFT